MEWWLLARSNFTRASKKAFDTLVVAVAWSLWKQRNARVFNWRNQQKTDDELHQHIMDEIKEWKEDGLGAGCLDSFLRE